MVKVAGPHGNQLAGVGRACRVSQGTFPGSWIPWIPGLLPSHRCSPQPHASLQRGGGAVNCPSPALSPHLELGCGLTPFEGKHLMGFLVSSTVRGGCSPLLRACLPPSPPLWHHRMLQRVGQGKSWPLCWNPSFAFEKGPGAAGRERGRERIHHTSCSTLSGHTCHLASPL